MKKNKYMLVVAVLIAIVTTSTFLGCSKEPLKDITIDHLFLTGNVEPGIISNISDTLQTKLNEAGARFIPGGIVLMCQVDPETSLTITKTTSSYFEFALKIRSTATTVEGKDLGFTSEATIYLGFHPEPLSQEIALLVDQIIKDIVKQKRTLVSN